MCIKVYTLKVTSILDNWDEMKDRDRQILPLDEAINVVHSSQKQSLLKLKDHLLKR